MSFRTHQVTAAGGAKPPITVTLWRPRGARCSLIVNLQPSQALAFGWEPGTPMQVAIGEGEHHGLIRLRPAPGGVAGIPLKTLHAGGNGKRGADYLRLSLGHCTQFTSTPQKKTAVAFEVLDGENAGWVELVLPPWADETSPARRERPAPAAAAAPAREDDPRAVHRRLMGDPPPGRSALARRGQG